MTRKRPSEEQIRRSIEIRGDAHQAQLEDYVELTGEFGVSDKEAARRLGVCLRTVRRYKTELRGGVS